MTSCVDGLLYLLACKIVVEVFDWLPIFLLNIFSCPVMLLGVVFGNKQVFIYKETGV